MHADLKQLEQRLASAMSTMDRAAVVELQREVGDFIRHGASESIPTAIAAVNAFSRAGALLLLASAPPPQSSVMLTQRVTGLDVQASSR